MQGPPPGRFTTHHSPFAIRDLSSAIRYSQSFFTHNGDQAMTANRPLVIDIYYGDQVQDFARTKAFGILGVIHKAREATGFTDKLYGVRRKLATDLRLKCDAYPFFHGADPLPHADQFIAASEPRADTLLPLPS